MLKTVIAVCLSLIFFASPLSYAQPATRAAATGPQKHIQTIIFSGLAGAVLGLSTLSFYGRPQDRLSNIPVGFAFGVIIGTAISTFKAATDPRDFYNYKDPSQPELWLESRVDRFQNVKEVTIAPTLFTLHFE